MPSNDAYPQPLDAAIVPRFAGLPTFFRLPVSETAQDVDIAILGVPFDGGTTNRAGARHGPREVRNQSSLIRRINFVTGVSPYDLVRVADLGDVPINPTDLVISLGRIETSVRAIRAEGARVLAVGGDHLISLPLLRATASGTPLGMVHFDAHSDTNDTYFGDSRFTHGTPFRRAIEEGHLDSKRVVQIGIRGSIYHESDLDFAKANGIRIISIDEFARRGVDDVAAEARDIVGDRPTYLTFDIDSIDPSMAPGTGTPEIGGLTTREAQNLVRSLQGIDVVGADLVEVSPPFDLGAMTAIVGASILFEILCLMAVRSTASESSR